MDQKGATVPRLELQVGEGTCSVLSHCPDFGFYPEEHGSQCGVWNRGTT